MSKKTISKEKILLEYTPMAITAIGILICAIIFEQMLIKILPLFFSLFIQLYMSRANRIAFLLGAANSVIYIIGYVMEGVYGTAMSTLFGIVLLLIAYFRWKKQSVGKATKFSAFTYKQRAVLAVFVSALWAASSFTLLAMGGKAVVLDGLVLVIGFAVPILNVRAYVESPTLNLIGFTAQAIIWIQLIVVEKNYASTTYLISTIYNLYTISRTFIRWRHLYNEQNKKATDDASLVAN